MRQVFYDTETTGVEPQNGDKIVEIAMVEALDGIPTGKVLHHIINPERRIPPETTLIHGLTDASVANKPKFKEILPEILAFMKNAEMIAHHGDFDIGMLNAEFKQANHDKTFWECCEKISDTQEMSKRVFPKSRHSLVALCKNLGVDDSHRVKHGALIDTELTVQVWKAMMERFPELNTPAEDYKNPAPRAAVVRLTAKPVLPVLKATEAEVLLAQQYFVPAAAASKPKP